jgi:hypothetical protein
LHGGLIENADAAIQVEHDKTPKRAPAALCP